MTSDENSGRGRRRGLYAGLTAATVVLGLVAVWLVGGALTAPVPRRAGPLPDDLTGEAITLTTDDGRALAGWHVRADASRGVVVLVHAIRSSRGQMVERARWLAGTGRSSVLIDLSAHGESDGERITLGAREAGDVRAAVAFAKRAHPDEPVALIGCSLGGASALLAGPLDLDALVVEAVYPTIDDAVHNRIARRLGAWSAPLAELLLVQLPWRLGVSRDALRPLDVIAAVDAPVLVLGGTADERTTAAETRALFDAARGPKRLHLFDGVAHVDLERAARDEYRAVVGAWLDRWFTSTRDDVELELWHDPTAGDEGRDDFGLRARITNHGDETVTLVGCLDGSQDSWRYPHYVFEVRRAGEVFSIQEPRGPCCGYGYVADPRPEQVVDLAPGVSFDPFDGRFERPLLTWFESDARPLAVRLHVRTDAPSIDAFGGGARGAGVQVAPHIQTPELRARVECVTPAHLVSDWVEIP